MIDPDDDDLPQGLRKWDRIKAHLRRELWAENRQPWTARIRIWEFALGGMGAALLAFWVLSRTAAPEAAGVLQAQISVADRAITIAALYDPALALLHMRWSAQEAQNASYAVWLRGQETLFHLGPMKQAAVFSIKLTEEQMRDLVPGATLVVSEHAGTDTAPALGRILAEGRLSAAAQ